jgi:hypothetical protein
LAPWLPNAVPDPTKRQYRDGVLLGLLSLRRAELYVKVGRMRILSSPKVVESAELVARRIVDTYLVPNKTFLELREMTINGSIDLLREFGEAFRAEFESLRSQFFRNQF